MKRQVSLHPPSISQATRSFIGGSSSSSSTRLRWKTLHPSLNSSAPPPPQCPHVISSISSTITCHCPSISSLALDFPSLPARCHTSFTTSPSPAHPSYPSHQPQLEAHVPPPACDLHRRKRPRATQAPGRLARLAFRAVATTPASQRRIWYDPVASSDAASPAACQELGEVLAPCHQLRCPAPILRATESSAASHWRRHRLQGLHRATSR